jgi:hypothetical protein
MTATKTTIIAGETFEIATPFVEGHVLTAGEAHHLNQTRVENIRNNSAKTIKAALETGDPAKLAEARAAVQAYDAEYVFTIGGSRGEAAPKLDPIEREARKIAKTIVTAELAKRNLKFATPPEGTSAEDWKAKMEANITKVAGLEGVLKAAKKAVEQAKKVRDEANVELDLTA